MSLFDFFRTPHRKQKEAPASYEAKSYDQGELVIGVISDTHIPDRVKFIHPGVVPFFKSANVQLILHAGDICVPSVLNVLEKVAPVIAVLGNRDWVFIRRLRQVQIIQAAGINIGLVHGHGGVKSYLSQKWKYVWDGYQLEQYLPVLKEYSPDVEIMVFGHTHYPLIHWHEGKMFFNPGSASAPSLYSKRNNPTVGILHIKNRKIYGEIVELEGFQLNKRQWAEKVGIENQNLKIS